MKCWTVYCHTHIESGRRYVGLTKKTIMQRWNQHVYMAKSAKGGRWHFPNAIRKYGKDAFEPLVLQKCSTLEIANAYEDYYVDLFRTRDLECGFNLAKGGEHKPHSIRKNPWDDPGFREKALQSLAKANSVSKDVRSNRSRDLWQRPDYREMMIEIVKEIHSRPGVKEKNATAHRGKKLSPEHRAKLGLSRRGKPLNSEHCAKISASLKGVVFSPEQRANISVAQRGRVLDAETRAKIGASHKGKPLSPEHRVKLSNALKGKKLSPEHVAKISAASKRKTFGPEQRANMSAAQKGKAISLEHRAKISETLKKRFRTISSG